jgi:hypothetical protein
MQQNGLEEPSPWNPRVDDNVAPLLLQDRRDLGRPARRQHRRKVAEETKQCRFPLDQQREFGLPSKVTNCSRTRERRFSGRSCGGPNQNRHVVQSLEVPVRKNTGRARKHLQDSGDLPILAIAADGSDGDGSNPQRPRSRSVNSGVRRSIRTVEQCSRI